MNRQTILVILITLIVTACLVMAYLVFSQPSDGLIHNTNAMQPRDLTPNEAEELMSDFASWSDICVESVKPLDVGQTKPFSPWSPDGEWIAYSNWFDISEKKRHNFDVTEPVGVYVIRYDGTGKRLVAPDGFRPSFGRYQWEIVYGKNGTTGATETYKNMSMREGDIWIVGFDGSGNRPIATGPENDVMKMYGGTSITYDGRSVVYNIMRDVAGGVGIADINGSNKRPLVVGSGLWGYSGDGKRIFVTSENAYKKSYIIGGWMDMLDAGIDVDDESAGKVEWVTRMNMDNYYGHPQVNLQGTMIAFDNPQYPFEERNIWVGTLDGSNRFYPVTDYGLNKTHGAFANHPRWGPDGKWIVYDEQTDVGGGQVRNKVMVVNVETKERKEIADLMVKDHCGFAEPGWSPDGKKIFFYAPDPDNRNKPSVWIAVLKNCSGVAGKTNGGPGTNETGYKNPSSLDTSSYPAFLRGVWASRIDEAREYLLRAGELRKAGFDTIALEVEIVLDPETEQPSSLSDDVWLFYLQAFKKAGFRVVLIPNPMHPNMDMCKGFDWDGNEENATYRRSYELLKRFDPVVLKWARIAEKYKADGFVPLNEPHILVADYTEAGRWLQEILPGIKKSYSGKLIAADTMSSSGRESVPYPYNYSGYDMVMCGPPAGRQDVSDWEGMITGYISAAGQHVKDYGLEGFGLYEWGGYSGGVWYEDAQMCPLDQCLSQEKAGKITKTGIEELGGKALLNFPRVSAGWADFGTSSFKATKDWYLSIGEAIKPLDDREWARDELIEMEKELGGKEYKYIFDVSEVNTTCP